MNEQIRILSVVGVVLLASLIVATTYWQTWAVGDLANRQDNAISLVARLTVDRGKILGPNGTVFAVSREHRQHGLTIFTRRYPTGDLAPQVIGYSTSAGTTAGLEKSLAASLTGANTNLSSSLSQELNKLGGQTVLGDNVILTLRPALQALALQELNGRCGAVGALDAHTGAIYAMASSPTYNPNLVEKPGGFAKIEKITGACGDSSALYNNATQGLYPPGSTFKMVTAAAALDSGTYTTTSNFYDPGYCIDYGQHVSNAGNPDQNGPETYGNVTLAQGFEHSINSVFCNVGEHIGGEEILKYAKRFGFYSRPPLDLPPSEIVPSGLYKSTKLWSPKSNSEIDAGRLAFGQWKMLATPLQMAMVAQTIANGGEEVDPYLVDRIVAPNGGVVSRTTPHMLGRPIKRRTAAELNQMMQLVIQGGTGTTAQIPGVAVAGKTGTAETGIAGVYDAWFVCFAPANNPRYVVVVAVEKQPNGFGGSVAAPIAKAMLEKLLGR